MEQLDNLMNFNFAQQQKLDDKLVQTADIVKEKHQIYSDYQNSLNQTGKLKNADMNMLESIKKLSDTDRNTLIQKSMDRLHNKGIDMNSGKMINTKIIADKSVKKTADESINLIETYITDFDTLKNVKAQVEMKKEEMNQAIDNLNSLKANSKNLDANLDPMTNQFSEKDYSKTFKKVNNIDLELMIQAPISAENSISTIKNGINQQVKTVETKMSERNKSYEDAKKLYDSAKTEKERAKQIKELVGLGLSEEEAIERIDGDKKENSKELEPPEAPKPDQRKKGRGRGGRGR